MPTTKNNVVFPMVMLTLLCCAPALSGGEEVKSLPIDFHMPDFKEITYPAGDEHVNRIVGSYESTIINLINQLQADLSAEQQTYVIYILGELRAIQARTILVERIDFEATKMDPRFKIGRWGRYPAAEALVKIGRPAINEILAKASRRQNESRLKQMAAVIHDVEGATFGKIIIEGYIAKAPNEEAGNNLRALLKHFDPE
jgi:hypothetical protein